VPEWAQALERVLELALVRAQGPEQVQQVPREEAKRFYLLGRRKIWKFPPID